MPAPSKRKKPLKIDCTGINRVQNKYVRMDNMRRGDQLSMQDLINQLKVLRDQEGDPVHQGGHKKSQSIPMSKITIQNPERKPLVIQKKKIVRWGAN